MNLEKDFYTIDEVCDLFGVTRATVYDWIKNRGSGMGPIWRAAAHYAPGA